MTYIEELLHKIGEFGNGRFEFETSEVESAITELKQEIRQLKADKKILQIEIAHLKAADSKLNFKAEAPHE